MATGLLLFCGVGRHGRPDGTTVRHAGAAVVHPGLHQHHTADIELVARGIRGRNDNQLCRIGGFFVTAPQMPEDDTCRAYGSGHSHLDVGIQPKMRRHCARSSAQGNNQQVNRAGEQFGAHQYGGSYPPQHCRMHRCVPPIIGEVRFGEMKTDGASMAQAASACLYLTAMVLLLIASVFA